VFVAQPSHGLVSGRDLSCGNLLLADRQYVEKGRRFFRDVRCGAS
jgi:hypothetical protein